MSVHASPSRPATKSVGAAVVDLVLTLAILVVGLLSFLIAPLAALGVAYLGYVVIRPRGRRAQGRGRGDLGSGSAFGSGASA
jgi:hypothetical protein